MKKILRLLLCLGLVLSFIPISAFAEEGKPESFWGKFETPDGSGDNVNINFTNLDRLIFTNLDQLSKSSKTSLTL